MDSGNLETRVVVVDTSAVVAALVRRDAEHPRAVAYLATPGLRFVIPLGIMSEIAYMLDARLSGQGLGGLLTAVARGIYTLDCGDGDIARIGELVRQYGDFPLGYADATVIACAERLRAPVFTFDRRHFTVVASAGTFSVVP